MQAESDEAESDEATTARVMKRPRVMKRLTELEDADGGAQRISMYMEGSSRPTSLHVVTW